MGMMFSLVAVLSLIAIAFLGVQLGGMNYFFGVIIPYAAIATFLVGVVYRIVKWASSPVPFRIPTTAGQQKSLSWIEWNKLDNPCTTGGVIGRMALEVLAFRSLFRNTKMELREGGKITYQWEKWLWLAALAFHWSFLVVFLRHLRFFTEPVPGVLAALESVDGFFQVGLPGIFISGFVLLLATLYLFTRRVIIPSMKYISLPADYFPLFLIMALATTGLLMRYLLRVDIASIKELAMGLVSFHPTIPEGIGVLFYIHLFLVSTLFAYFPFSKLMHMGGIFLSPTRNLPNDTRIRRHINPWNYPVKTHTYEEYEEEFREKMIEAGLPVEKE